MLALALCHHMPDLQVLCVKICSVLRPHVQMTDPVCQLESEADVQH